MMVDHGINPRFAIEGMPACLRLAVDHDHGFGCVPGDFVDRRQMQVQGLDHGAILRPEDDTVLGDLRRNANT